MNKNKNLGGTVDLITSGITSAFESVNGDDVPIYDVPSASKALETWLDDIANVIDDNRELFRVVVKHKDYLQHDEIRLNERYRELTDLIEDLRNPDGFHSDSHLSIEENQEALEMALEFTIHSISLQLHDTDIAIDQANDMIYGCYDKVLFVKKMVLQALFQNEDYGVESFNHEADCLFRDNDKLRTEMLSSYSTSGLMLEELE